MIADVAGFSRLMELAESRTFDRVRRVREDIATPTVEKCGGRIIKTTGDGFLAEFASAIAALRCGIEIQRSVIALEADQPVETRIRLRIGINVGDIIIDGTDIAGDGVNIAARLEAMAPVDGICISSMVHDQIRDDLGVVFQDLGQQHLKNIARPVRAFTVNVGGRVVEEYSSGSEHSVSAGGAGSGLPRGITSTQTLPRRAPVRPLATAVAGLAVVILVLAGIAWYWHAHWNEAGSPAFAANKATAAQTTALSIMVLPFANQTGDAQKAYIADALTSSITSDLSRIRDVFVIPPSTAFTYKDKAVSVQQVGRDYDVHFVLQGNVASNGQKVRINATLADTQSGAQLWSETFDGDVTNLFELQDRVTTRIGDSIGREMVIVAARESETRMSSPKVADLMMRARALNLKPQSFKNWDQMEAWYRQVLTLEPDNVKAMERLANALAIQANNYGGQLPPDVKEKKYAEARDLGLRVREMDPDNPGIYTALGLYAASHDDYGGYRRAAEARLALEPKSTVAYNNLASALISTGEPKRAIELLTQALNMDPKHPDVILLNMGEAYFMLGDNDAAIEWLLKAREETPTIPNTYADLAMAYALRGDDAKVYAAMADLRRLAPNFKVPDLSPPSPSSPAAYKEFWEKKLLPAARKAGIPE
jgi:TolB-like protein/Flp pilus assembly protein TadD